MVLTREIEAAIEAAGLTVRDTHSGCVIGTASNAALLFKDSPLRILSLYSAAALLGAEVKLDAIEAANENAHSVNNLPPLKIFEAINGILMSENPHVLAPLINAGAFEAFGIKAGFECLHTLKSVPRAQTARWWAFIKLTKTDGKSLVKNLELPAKLCVGVDTYTRFWHTKPPIALINLKLALAPLPHFNAALAAQCFVIFDARWQTVPALFKKLEASGEAYRMPQLAITAPELAQLQIPRKRIPRIMGQLLTAVCKTPVINTYPALCALAQTLSRSTFL